MSSLAGIRILLVEDDDDIREAMHIALASRGAVMVSVSGSAEALAAIETEQPDVVVSDIAMPGESGHAFMKKVRALPRTRGGRIPAVAVTAFDSREARLESSYSGFHYHLAKPVDPDKLVDIVAGLARLTRRA